MPTKLRYYTLELGILMPTLEDAALRELMTHLKHQGVLYYLATREDAVNGRVVMFFLRTELGKAALHGLIEASLTDTNTRHALEFLELVSVEPTTIMIAALPIHDFFPPR